jgi:selenide, water dikinase
MEILEQILAGGLSKMIEAQCTVIGGHSVRDPEIKFGYAVTGFVHPDRVLANSGAQVLDALILTKPLGTGVISTAIKKAKAEQSWISAAVQSMTTLNAMAAEVIATGKFRVHSATDITGFGLIGHAREMAQASGVSMSINSANLILLPGAIDCIRASHIPGGLKANRDFAECQVGYENEIPDEIKTILFDPQTSGGLLLAVARSDAESFLRTLKATGVPAAEIGEILPQGKPLIQVR